MLGHSKGSDECRGPATLPNLAQAFQYHSDGDIFFFCSARSCGRMELTGGAQHSPSRWGSKPISPRAYPGIQDAWTASLGVVTSGLAA